MSNSGKKFRALRDQKINSNSYAVEKKILNETKYHNNPPPSFKLNGRSLSLQIINL